MPSRAPSPSTTTFASAAAVSTNPRFKRTVGPCESLLAGVDLLTACIGKEEHERFKIALKRAREAREVPEVDDPSKDDRGSDIVEWSTTPTVRDCWTLSMGNTGDFPIWRRMDWAIAVLDETHLCLSGRIVSSRPGAEAEASTTDTDEPGATEIDVWLSNISPHLAQYAPVFREQGYDTKDFLLEANSQDQGELLAALDAADIKKPHKKMLERRLNDLVNSPRAKALNGSSASAAGTPTSSSRAPHEPSERELLDFLNKAPIAMHWLSGTGHVLWANQTELNVLGYTAEEYIGQPIMKFCPDETPLVLEIFKSLGSGNAIKDVPVRFRTKDGRIKHLLIDSNVNWNADGSFKHTRCFIRDDTARQVREARLRVMKDKEEELAIAKDVFFRKIFHEIRTPTHCLSYVVDAIADYFEQEASPNEERDSLFRMLQSDFSKLMSLVDDAADASLFHLGRVPILRSRPFGIKSEVTRLCNDLVVKMESGGINGTVVFGHGWEAGSPWSALEGSQDETVWSQSNLPKRVMGDCSRIVRVIRHLSEYALHRTPEGGTVKIQVTYWPAVSAEVQDRYTFSVSDTGAGLDAASVHDRFQSYFNIKPLADYNPTTNGYNSKSDLVIEENAGEGGCDLGLFVIFNLVQTLGGCLECISTESGSTFSFTIPLAPVAAIPAGVDLQADVSKSPTREESMANAEGDWEEITENPLASSIIQSPSSGDETNADLPPPVGILADLKRRPHVLVVDQSVVSQRVTSKTLKAMGCTVELAGNGLQALHLLQSNTDYYDVVLMELYMPVMDGVECARRVRLDSRFNLLPFVAFEADASLTLEQVKDLGFQGLCVKPATKRLIQQELDRVLEEGSNAATTAATAGLNMNAGSGSGGAASSAAAEAPAAPSQLPAPPNSISPDGTPSPRGSLRSLGSSALSAVGKTTTDPAGTMAPPPARRKGSGAATVSPTGSTPRCLIVEDSKVCARLATKMMEKLGFDCELADNGLKGLDLLKEDNNRADLVLMDLRMPVMGGMESTKRIREELGLKELPIVAMTGELVDEEWAGNFDGIVNKPAGIPVIRQELKRVLPWWEEPQGGVDQAGKKQKT